MPTYEYECQKCGHRFEEFQSMKDAPLAKCPQCKGKLKRLIGAGAGLIFKGSGFYSTDYRSSSYGDKKKKDAAPAGGSGDAGSGGSGGAAAPSPGGKETKGSKGAKKAKD